MANDQESGDESPFTEDDYNKVVGYEAEAMALELALGESSREADDYTMQRHLQNWIHRGTVHKREPVTEFALAGGFATSLVLANALRTTAVILRRVHPEHLDELLAVFADVPGEERNAGHEIWRELITREQLSRVPKGLS